MGALDERLVREHTKCFQEQHPAVRSCRVTLEERPARRYERRRFNVRLDIALDARALVINRENDEDPAAALRDAFQAARLQLDTLQC
ncbi:MAG TPA: hypothetical protein VM489_02930 [Burkholderiales bacterium]|nr:hypothetical protein [Burkholderiales bacterium]